MVKICPRCQQRYSQAKHTGDYVHECHSGNPTLDQEDVLVIGDWTDYTGSATVSPKITSTAGVGATNFGRRSWIEGERVDESTPRGNNEDTHRQRQHEEYIEDDC